MIATHCHPNTREALEKLWRSQLPQDGYELRRIDLSTIDDENQVLQNEIYETLSKHFDLRIYDPDTLSVDTLRIDRRPTSLANFETPTEEIRDCFEHSLCVNNSRPRGIKVLDPSCGTGNWLRACLDEMPQADAVGIEKDLVTVIEARARGLNVIHGDFLKMELEEESYDLILMSPPAQGKEWLLHVKKAVTLLKKDFRSTLIAFLPRSGFYSKYAQRFRNFLAEHEAYWEPLYWGPSNKFSADPEMIYLDFSFRSEEAIEWNWRGNGRYSTYANSIILLLENDASFMGLSTCQRIANLDHYVRRTMVASDWRCLWDEKIKSEVKQYFKENP